jgi:hypothetical protein
MHVMLTEDSIARITNGLPLREFIRNEWDSRVEVVAYDRERAEREEPTDQQPDGGAYYRAVAAAEREMERLFLADLSKPGGAFELFRAAFAESLRATYLAWSSEQPTPIEFAAAERVTNLLIDGLPPLEALANSDVADLARPDLKLSGDASGDANDRLIPQRKDVERRVLEAAIPGLRKSVPPIIASALHSVTQRQGRRS